MEMARPMARHAEEQQWDRCPDGPDRHRGIDLATNILSKSGLTTAGMGKPTSNKTVNDDRAIGKRGKRTSMIAQQWRRPKSVRNRWSGQTGMAINPKMAEH